MSDRQLSKYTPAYEPVHTKEPNATEKKMDSIFQQFMDVEIKIESDIEMRRRDEVLTKVREIFVSWVKYVATNVLHLPDDAAEDAGGEIFISGSHKLGVRDIGADIDTVCVAPAFCTREHFFSFLKEDIARRQEVTDLVAIETAFVPLISFDFSGVSIDLLFARLAVNVVPKDLDILDDEVLIGLDNETEKSLNGPRVTEMIVKLVGPKTFPNFLIVLRFIRKWAKRRGIYGNKLGYLGGVNCNILVAFICQLFPTSGPSALLVRFFKSYKEWRWPDPIMLNNIQQHPPGQLISAEREVWSPLNNPNDLMPIITPAYPAMNSAYNVSPHSFQVMYDEIVRGYQIAERILKEKQWQNPDSWREILDYSDFFLKYKHYLACHIVGVGEDAESKGWIGFVESRIRRITGYLAMLPLKMPVHLFPVQYKTAKSANSICYFVGFDVDVEALTENGGTNEINVDSYVGRFQDSLLDPEKGYKGERIEGLDFYVEHLKWKELPREVFKEYGGFDVAKEKRKVLLQNQAAAVNSAKAASSSAAAAAAASAAGSGDGEGLSAFEQKLAAVDGANKDASAATGTVRRVNVKPEVKTERKETVLSCLKEFQEFGPDGLPTMTAIRKRLLSHVTTSREELLAATKRARVDSIAEWQERQKAKYRLNDASFSVPEVTWVMQDGK